jgi:lysozyme
MSKLIQTLKHDEGLRLRAYQDHLGIWTIGYGTNLQVLEIAEGLAERWLRDKVDAIRLRADQLPTFTLLNSARKDVILSMMYQMGIQGTLNFKKMWEALEDENFMEAGHQMRDSKWWKDLKTRQRAERMAIRMETGVW